MAQPTVVGCVSYADLMQTCVLLLWMLRAAVMPAPAGASQADSYLLQEVNQVPALVYQLATHASAAYAEQHGSAQEWLAVQAWLSHTLSVQHELNFRELLHGN
jgi:hypothetical protein